MTTTEKVLPVFSSAYGHCTHCDWMLIYEKDAQGRWGYTHGPNGRNCPNEGKRFSPPACEELK